MKNNYNNNSEEENFLFGPDKKLPFALPEGYFDAFLAKMVLKFEVYSELNDLPTLQAMNKKNQLELPADYFKKSLNKLEYTYELSQFKTLGSIPKPTEAQWNDEYQKHLNSQKQVKVDTNELSGFTVLSAMKKENAFAVQPDYFDNVEQQVKEKYKASQNEQGARIINLWSIVRNPRVAIAASIVLIFGISAVWYASRPKPIVVPGDCHTLACLEKNELLNEHNVRDFDEDNLYDMVDVESLDKQLSSDSTTVTSVATDSAQKISKD